MAAPVNLGLFKIIEEEMLQRLSWMTLQPKKIFAVGEICSLAKHFPDALINVDRHCEEDVSPTKQSSAFSGSPRPLRGLAMTPSMQYDLIFANMVLPWRESLQQTLMQWQKMLRKDGLLMLSCLGVDTLQEISSAKSSQLYLYDMHNVGDVFLQTGFTDPVIDVENITLRYRDSKTLFDEMLTYQFISKEIASSKLQLTLEVIYAHAWSTGTLNFTTNSEGVVHIPIDSLRKKIILLTSIK